MWLIIIEWHVLFHFFGLPRDIDGILLGLLFHLGVFMRGVN